MISMEQLSADLAKAKAYGSALAEAASLLPGMIASAETLLPAQGQGAQKLQMVQNWIEGALAWAGHAADVVKAIWPQIEPVIAMLVTLYTGNGTFAALLGQTVPKQPAQQ